MAHEILMPKLSSTMDTGTITMWLKQVGDPIEIGEAIFEVMTDKIAIEVEAYEEGVLLARYIGDGESAPVNSVIGYIGEAEETVPAEAPAMETSVAPEQASQEEIEAAPTAPEGSSKDTPPSETVLGTTRTKIRATPAARRLARENGLDLRRIQGSGPKGRIQATDVQGASAVSSPEANQTTKSAETKVIPWEGMRKVIADRMAESKATIPHVTMEAEVDMREAVQLREQLLPMIEAQTGLRLSYTELIMKATMVALKEFPIFNAQALADGIHLFNHVNMGLAVAVPEGLMVPVIQQADQLGLSQLTQATKEQTQKAREGRLMPTDMQGGTFTISSLGPSKVQSFNPVINAPEVAILGVGGLTERWDRVGEVGSESFEKIPVLTLCLSFDHRVADGAPAAAFLSRVVELLETPMGLLL